MVAKDSVSRSHIRSGVFAWYGIRRAVRKGVERNPLVDFFQQHFVKYVLRVLHHILERIKMVKHFERLEKSLSCWNHPQSFLLKFPGVVHRKGVALNGARMGRKEHFIIFNVLLSVHLVDDKRLILAPQILVFIDFLFYCHNHLSLLMAKIVQTESIISSLLEYFAEVQPILCKDNANRVQYKTNPVLFYFRDVSPTNSTAH